MKHMKHIPTFESFLNEESQKIDESVTAIAIGALVTLLGIGGAAVAGTLGTIIVDTAVNGFINRLSNISDKVRKVVNPSDVEKFGKIIEKDPAYNKELLAMLEKIGGAKNVFNWMSFSKDMIELPTFKKQFAEFVKDHKISDLSANFLLTEIRRAIADTMSDNAQDIVEDIKKKFPQKS